MNEWKFAEGEHVRVVQATDSTRLEEIGQTGIVVGYSSPDTVLVQMDSDVNPTPVSRYDNYYGGGELNPFPERDLEIYDPPAVTSKEMNDIPESLLEARGPAIDDDCLSIFETGGEVVSAVVDPRLLSRLMARDDFVREVDRSGNDVATNYMGRIRDTRIYAYPDPQWLVGLRNKIFDHAMEFFREPKDD